MPSMNAGSVEMQILFCAMVLGLVQLVLAVTASVLGRGMPWGVGPRDETAPALGKYSGRIERAWQNFIESFPLFAGAVLLAHLLDKSTATSAHGAQIYIWARLLYVPAYVIAIPFVRTLIWTASIVGIVMVLLAMWPGL